MSFIYHCTVHFQDTDAAGVVYFANVLTFCHEAYEASLMAAGIDLKAFFQSATLAVPIVHATVDFMSPMGVGDQLSLHLTPRALKPSEFEVTYKIFGAATDRMISQALTRHVCIDPSTRTRKVLTPELSAWLNTT
jgi:1,4-dihydroxy-2-naphthoyl-CoA hydrolase